MRLRFRRPAAGAATIALVFLALATNVAHAGPILVDESFFVGQRNIGNGIVGGDEWANSFDLDFLIEDLGGGQWRYSYQFFIDAPDPSHFIFEVSDTITTDNVNETILSPNFLFEDDNPRFYGPGDPGQSNPGLETDIYGIKAEPLLTEFPTFYTFISTRAPIWGDFYVKGGNESFAFNTGIGTDPDESTTVFTNWIPVPDTTNGQGQAPEPGTLLLLGVVLTALYRRRPS